MLKKDNLYFYIFAAIAAVYAVIVLSLPVNKLVLTHYHLSLTGLRLIELTYLIPQLLIWSAAYYGYSRIIKYTRSIGDDKDAYQIKKIGFGIAVLAFGGPSNGVISSVLNTISEHHVRLIPSATITENYLSLAVSLTSFLLIGAGASGLLSIVRGRTSYKELFLLNLLFVIIAGAFCYLIFHKLPNALSFGLASKPIYYLPNWLLLFTLVIPYLFVWLLGGVAVLNIRAYQLKVKGIIYKKSMLFFEVGLTLIILSLILLQYLTTVSSKLISLKILPLLLVIYPLLIVIGAGYVCVALGAKKLQRIEES